MSENTDAAQAATTAKLIAVGVWEFLKEHPVALAILAFVIGFMIG